MALEAAPYDLVIEQGSTLWLGFAFKDPAGNLIDTAGYTARAKVRATYDGPVLLDMSTTNGRLTVGIQGTAPEQWNVEMNVTAATTAALTFTEIGVWDMELVDPFGNVKRVVQGAAMLSPEATYE